MMFFYLRETLLRLQLFLREPSRNGAIVATIANVHMASILKPLNNGLRSMESGWK
jgi:hypothetical protein